MKKLFLIICLLTSLVSCVEEVPRAHLLEYEIGWHLYANEGYAYRFTDYNNDVRLGFDWHIYNLGQGALDIQAYDESFTKTIFTYPEFQATFIVELAQGESKTYRATEGQFRILGQEMGDVTGDFNFKIKNILNPDDSLMVDNGYFRIWLESSDRFFTK